MSELTRDELARLIGERRRALGLTKWELARRVGVSPYTIRLWEGGLSTPKDENLRRLLEVLGGER